jgi:competence protein ComEC
MPLFWLCLAFLCGILLSSSFPLPILGWSLLALFALLLFLPPISRRLFSRLPSRLNTFADSLKLSSPALFPLMLLFLSLGAIRYQISQPNIDPSFIAYYNDQPIEYIIEGVVADPPDVRDTYVNLHLRMEQLQTVDASQFVPVHGLLLARVSINTSYNYGDRIRLQGHLVTPPENEDFSYRDYLANRGIYSYIAYPTTSLLQQGQGNPFYTALYSFRQHALDLVYSFYPDPEASLMAGILLGVQSGIPQDVQEAFRFTGTSHIIVISGFDPLM